MICSIFSSVWRFFLSLFRTAEHKKLSILVPYHAGGDTMRIRDWEWIKRYMEWHLPEAEIIIGTDKKQRRNGGVFSKAAAVNEAFKRSHGDIIVVMDADALIDTTIIRHAAERIRAARRVGVQTWCIPYHYLYRLTQKATEKILNSDPRFFPNFPKPMPQELVESMLGSGHGRRFGALCLIMPREAFITTSGMDNRFRGWGGEDISWVHALDTLWGKHFNTPNSIFHLWHPRMSVGDWTDPTHQNWEVRIWPGQVKPRVNDRLASRYHQANGNVEKMSRLVREKGA
jgi:hypothetical protein